MFRIGGFVQNYPWGRPGGLNPWLPVAEQNDLPQAELWFGAHPNGASPLLDSAGTLAEVVGEGEVPLLVKLLAAETPLSIQLHPEEKLAAAWYEQGSHLVSDPLAKVEMLLALEPFAIFAGWRAPAQSLRIFAQAGGFDDVCAALAAADVRTAAKLLLATNRGDVPQRFLDLLEAIQSIGCDSEELHALALAGRSYPDDPGLLVVMLLDHHLLPVHDAVYMPAGGVHCYVQGLGLEVMTASDNVLRLGLTAKEIAIAEALEAIRDDGDPHFLGADSSVYLGHVNRFDYHTDRAPFTTTVVRDSSIVQPDDAYRLVLCLGGETVVSQADRVLVLHPGQACAILASTGVADITVSGTAAVIRATS
jgi:mannose-6-phosphate isomerase